MRLLCLSNGHGEDTIALRILQALQQQSADAQLSLTIEALPIVGEGHVYQQAQIPTIGTVQTMPSGGFIYMDRRQLARDIQGGLVQLTLAQIRAVRSWVQSSQGKPAMILAVGDIVPLLFAWCSGCAYGFVGTAKSEYYLRQEQGWLPRASWWDDRLERSTGCIYHPWERWLLKRPNCRAVFPRDPLTTEILQQFGIAAVDLGNPMMDGLETARSAMNSDSELLTIALIPGSRPPEAYANWELILKSLDSVHQALSQPVEYLAAIVSSLETPVLDQKLQDHGWHRKDAETYHHDQFPATLRLMANQFATCAHRSDCAIALAGTATEQFVGLGKPAILLPGAGPQFTPAFAEAQTRLLGISAILVPQPQQVGETLKAILQDATCRQAIAENGQRRMGEPGAAQRIAAHLIQQITRGN